MLEDKQRMDEEGCIGGMEVNAEPGARKHSNIYCAQLPASTFMNPSCAHSSRKHDLAF